MIYVLIGNKDETHANCLTTKDGHEQHLLSTNEIKKEFDAKNWDIARIVYQVYNGNIVDIDRFIKDLSAHYGYVAFKNPILRLFVK